MPSRGRTPFARPDPPPPSAPTSTPTGAPHPCHPKGRQHPAPFPLVHLIHFGCAYHAGARIARPVDNELPHAIMAFATEVKTIACRLGIRSCVRPRRGAHLDVHWQVSASYTFVGVVPSPCAAGRGRESCERGSGQPVMQPGPHGARQGCSDSSRSDGCVITLVWV